MQKLIEYKRMIKAICNDYEMIDTVFHYKITIILEPSKKQNHLKYAISKTKKQFQDLYNLLKQEIFDLEEHFKKDTFTVIQKKDPQIVIGMINAFLNQTFQRIDILTHKRFVDFFQIENSYEEYFIIYPKESKEDQKWLSLIKEKEKIKKTQKKQNPYCTVTPWNKQDIAQHSESKIQKSNIKNLQKPQKIFSAFTKLIYFEESHKIDINENVVIDFVYDVIGKSEYLFVIEQAKKTAKIKSIFKSFLNKSSTLGAISVFKKENKKITKISSKELQFEPISLSWSNKSSMITIGTQMGVYIFLFSIHEQLDLIELVSLPGTLSFASNDHLAEIYIITSYESKQDLYAYSVNSQDKIKIALKFKDLSSIAFEEPSQRLFINDFKGINIFSIVGVMEFELLHIIPSECTFNKLIIGEGFLFGLNTHGFATVIQIKAAGKEQFMSILTNIDIPHNTLNFQVFKLNKKRILTNYNNCIALIDTMDGPLFSLKQIFGNQIRKIQFQHKSNRFLVFNSDGWLNEYYLNPSML